MNQGFLCAKGNVERMVAERLMAALDDGTLSVRTEGDTLIAEGDIDLYQAPAFRDAAQVHVDQADFPRLDLKGVSFLDSAGLAVLLSLARQAKAQNKTLRVLSIGSPRRVLKITGIDRVLQMEE